MSFRAVRIQLQRALEMSLGYESIPVVPDGQHAELRMCRREIAVDLHRLFCRELCLGHDLGSLNVSRGGGAVGIREADVGKGVVRVDRRRLLQVLDPFLDFRQGDLLDVVPPLR